MRRLIRWAGVGVLIALVLAIIAIRLSASSTNEPMMAARSLARAHDSHYSPSGLYVMPTVSNIDGKNVRLVNGLPVVNYGGSIGAQTNPVTTAQYGLYEYARYLETRSSANRSAVIRVADWFVANQTRGGEWLEDFPFAYHGWALGAPWASALGQGQAMSLLERAYRMTGDRRYLHAAVRAMRPLTISVEDGGLERCFMDDCRLPFFEEYPSSPPSYVLNGFMFTLVGLYDLASVAPHSEASNLYRAGRSTLQVALPAYDRGGKATYDLATDRVAAPGYQAIHVYLLHALNSITPDATFRRFAQRWSRSLIS